MITNNEVLEHIKSVLGEDAFITETVFIHDDSVCKHLLDYEGKDIPEKVEEVSTLIEVLESTKNNGYTLIESDEELLKWLYIHRSIGLVHSVVLLEF